MSKLSISKAWDETKSVIAHDGGLLFTVSLALIAFPITIGNFTGPAMTTSEPLKPGGWLLVGFAVFLIALSGLLSISSLAIRTGIRVGDAVARGFRRLFTFSIVAFGLLFAVGFCGALIVAATSSNPSPIFAIQILVLLFLASSPLFARLSVMPAVAASEDGGPVHLLSRSWSITRGSTFRLWGLIVLLCVAGLILELSVGMTFGSIFTLLVGPVEPWSASKLLLAAVMGILRAVEFLLFGVLLARIYVQLAERGGASVPRSGT